MQTRKYLKIFGHLILKYIKKKGNLKDPSLQKGGCLWQNLKD